jgi:peroxiredoxin
MKHKIVTSLILTYILFAAHGIHANGSKSQNVPQSAQDICPIKVGQNIPKINLETIAGELFDLNEAVGKKPTLLIVYRGGWCPYCNKHLSRIGEIEQKVLDLGYQIFAVSTDQPEKLKETLAKHKPKYTLLSDHTMEASKALGLAFQMPDELVKKYKNQYKIDLEGASGETHHLLPVPAAMIIGTDGVIRFSYINPDYKVRIDTAVLLAAAKAYK